MKSQKLLEKQTTFSNTNSQKISNNANQQSNLNIPEIQYNQLKISITSSIISQIYSQLCISTSDFYGFLLGENKLIKLTESKDSESNFQQNILNLVINNIIFIYDKNYLRERLDKLLDRINQKYTIIGLFSARAFSYPSISLKEQEFYLNALNYLKTKNLNYEKKNNPIQNIQNVSLLYGVFCHNVTDEDPETKLKTQNFYSKIFKFVEKNLPYEILNIKDTTYTNPVNLLATKTVIEPSSGDFEKQIKKLKTIVLDQMTHLEHSQQRELKELKAELKKELILNKKLYDILKKYET